METATSAKSTALWLNNADDGTLVGGRACWVVVVSFGLMDERESLEVSNDATLLNFGPRMPDEEVGS